MMVVNSVSSGFRQGIGRPARFLCAGVCIGCIGLVLSFFPVLAQEAHHHHGAAADTSGDHGSDKALQPMPVFIASTAKPFAALMDDAMLVMDDGMKRAPMNGQSEHDFLTMMIPHHQGAVDMAKAVLLYTKDPAICNLALGIIAEQQNEIKLMQVWLKQHPDGVGK